MIEYPCKSKLNAQATPLKLQPRFEQLVVPPQQHDSTTTADTNSRRQIDF